jgi:ubiquinone/menaquinone biosynthesis C-methylase UbiE
MVTYAWDEQMCRRYAEGLRPVARFDHRHWAKKIVAAIGDMPTGTVLLDVATGPGFLLIEIGRRMPGLQLIAQDSAEPMLTIAQEEAQQAKLKLHTVCSTAEAIKLDDASVDVVTCKQLLHEAQDPHKVLDEMYRILKPQGQLFLIDFDADGSRLAAIAVKTMLSLTRSKEIARDFWRSFSAGKRGKDVRASLVSCGFLDVSYRRSGFNYFISATK